MKIVLLPNINKITLRQYHNCICNFFFVYSSLLFTQYIHSNVFLSLIHFTLKSSNIYSFSCRNYSVELIPKWLPLCSQYTVWHNCIVEPTGREQIKGWKKHIKHLNKLLSNRNGFKTYWHTFLMSPNNILPKYILSVDVLMMVLESTV